LPELEGTYLEAFEGAPRVRTFKAGTKIYRSPVTGEVAEQPGNWFGTRRTTTKIGTESQSNVVKWDNQLEKLRTYEFTEDATVYWGRVAGGKGYQVFFPKGLDPASVLRFVSESPLK
jgi:hypothetical protein